MIQKWPKNDPNMIVKWPRNDPKMTQKWPRHELPRREATIWPGTEPERCSGPGAESTLPDPPYSSHANEQTTQFNHQFQNSITQHVQNDEEARAGWSAPSTGTRPNLTAPRIKPIFPLILIFPIFPTFLSFPIFPLFIIIPIFPISNIFTISNISIV